MSEQATSAGFDYRVRVNRRARRARITVNHNGEVVVVVPRPLTERAIRQLLAGHHDWIAARQAELAERLAGLPPQLGLQPPRIDLRALDEQWTVAYAVDLGRQRWRGCRPSRHLQLRAAPGEPEARAGLQAWLQCRARAILPPWLEQLSERLGLICTGVSIRAQKTRWGSCSSSGRINLNRNLLFLPAELVEYLLVHELCHLREPNHSARYWQQVENALPDYRQRDRALRDAVTEVPLWARPGG
ncbi:MAG: M48 family metallopeptidase [Thiohalophilus sp.]